MFKFNNLVFEPSRFRSVFARRIGKLGAKAGKWTFWQM